MMNGLNIDFPIYYDDGNGIRTSFHGMVLKKAVVDGVVMSLSDKITGDVVYNGSDLQFTMQEYVLYNDVKYSLVNPPTVVREGLVADNSDLKGATRYSFEFYHPMYMLSNFPFTDVAVSFDEIRYKSHDKSFSWIGKPLDYVNKLNKNLEGTEFVVVLSSSVSQGIIDTLSDVLTFDNSTIADALKTGYDTWGLPYVVDKLEESQYFFTDANNNNVDYYSIEGGKKRFVIIFGLPANEIYENETQKLLGNPFVFQFGQGVGLKNNSRTPRNNKIVTRIAGYGSETNIPYGYPQIRWYGDPDATCTIGDSVGIQENVTINGVFYERIMSYPIYMGIVGGEYVKLIKHPFTRSHLMPSVYANSIFNKVSQYKVDENENVIFNPDFMPDVEIVDYYDAVGSDYPNKINLSAPSYEIHEFEDIKPELGEANILSANPINADLTDADGWDDTMDDDGNYLQSYFKITLPQLTFDIYACAAITEEMKINMRSGACIGCTFTVQVDWEDYKRNFYDSDMNFAPNGSQRDLTRYPNSKDGSISVIVQKDINTFGTLMPNIYQNPAAGDAFVVLGISLPLEYITDAQERLDAAMKSYMLENNVYYFDYPLKFDEHFLANRTYILNQIRPNSIIRFRYNNEILELFVKQLTIKYNESVLPQYDITLTDNVEIVLNQIGQVADDVEKLGTLIAMLRQNFGNNVIYELAKKLSKVSDDAAAGHITFTQGTTISDDGFTSGWLVGNGARIDKDGNAEFENVRVRGSMTASEIVFNLIDAEEGESIRSIGHGIIDTVEMIDATHGTATLRMDEDEYATIDENDICRGMYNILSRDGYANQEEGDDYNGFRNQVGFFSSYFTIDDDSVVKSKGSCTFNFTLQTVDKNGSPVINYPPCEGMKFVAYGNTVNTARQSCMYTSAVGQAPKRLYLAGIDHYWIEPRNVKIAQGYIEGVRVTEVITQSEYISYYAQEPSSVFTSNGKYYHYKTLHGDAGFYCEDNIYFGGILNQFTAADWDAIRDELGQGIHAQLLRGSDNIIVDALGNVVGGLYVQDGNITTYKLHTGVIVYDSGKDRYLDVASNNSEIGENEFGLYVTANGCSVLRDGADVYITSIANTANGNTPLTDGELEVMRNTDEITVDFIVVTANGWRTQMTYPVKITHLDTSYITFDLTNEMDTFAYRTQTKRYDGLPLSTSIKGYVNGEEADIVSLYATSDFWGGSTIVLDDVHPNVIKYYGGSNTDSYGIKATITRNGTLTLSHTSSLNDEVDIPDAKHEFTLSCVVKYAGVNYTSPAYKFIVTETTDATLYKLLLSANSVLKDEGTYTPSTIDVQVQVYSDSGMSVFTPNASTGHVVGNIYVKYINGIYDPSVSASTLISSWSATMPSSFDVIPTCLTILVVDLSDQSSPVVLDVESIPMTAKGRDGAGQPWVKVDPDKIIIDCNSVGEIKETKQFNVTAKLYWGDNLCTLNTANCGISRPDDETSDPDEFIGGNTTAKRSFKFTQGDILSSTYINVHLEGTYNDGTTTTSHTADTSIVVQANTQGAQGVQGASGAAIVFAGAWDSEIYYVWNNNIRNAVKHNGSYWFVNKRTNGEDLLGIEPTSEHTEEWLDVGALNFVATELLLAENGTINLFSSNIINLFNGSTKVATINGDGYGSYCIYYESGNKRMELSYSGYLYYYNDNAENTWNWRIGHGGDINKSRSDDWLPYWLCNVGNGGIEPPSNSLTNFRNDTTYNRTEYYKFISGGNSFTDYDKCLFVYKPTNDNPTNTTPLPSGWYTPNIEVLHKIDDEGETMLYYITIYKVEQTTSDGVTTSRITERWLRIWDGNSYENRQDALLPND